MSTLSKIVLSCGLKEEDELTVDEELKEEEEELKEEPWPSNF